MGAICILHIDAGPTVATATFAAKNMLKRPIRHAGLHNTASGNGWHCSHMQASSHLDTSVLQRCHCCRLLRPEGELWLVGLSGGQTVSTRIATGKHCCLAEISADAQLHTGAWACHNSLLPGCSGSSSVACLNARPCCGCRCLGAGAQAAARAGWWMPYTDDAVLPGHWLAASAHSSSAGGLDVL